jgi:multidrug resistance protein MdtO
MPLSRSFEQVPPSLFSESAPAKERQKASFLAADWSMNPVYTSFALRATLATMGCYVFMSLADWTEIHTSMITCVVTALVVAEEGVHKQTLRLGGVVLGVSTAWSRWFSGFPDLIPSWDY